MPRTKVKVLYDYPNGWSLIQFKYSTKSTDGGLTKKGTYFVRTTNLADTKKKATPLVIGYSRHGSVWTKIIYGYTTNQVKRLFKKQTARSKWIVKNRLLTGSFGREVTDDMYSYLYSKLDSESKKDLERNFKFERAIIYTNGKRRWICYMSSPTISRARDSELKGYGHVFHDRFM